MSELTFHVDGKFEAIDLAGIYYLKSYGNYVKIVTQIETFVVKITTNRLENTLPEEMFIRVHKSYIVNIKMIHNVSEEMILLLDQTNIPIGKTYKRYVKKVLSKYFKS